MFMLSSYSLHGELKIYRITLLKILIVDRKNLIQLNQVSVPCRWELGRVLDTRKENDYNSEFSQVMLEVAIFESTGTVLVSKQIPLNSHTRDKFHN